ncbi:MAG TPA: hypothetical protein PK440_22250 [Candidatus Accumulibacter phosphatis]|nr:hypothetical protein [Candidatus Accumulibacter phosphatis]HRQ97671.1 hypothetical protein [Candidatus Accumulibacter phosphatis]
MTTTLIRLARRALHVTLVLAVVATSLPATAGNWGARREYREGMREIARERREMRREVRREVRYGRWDRDRDRRGDIVAGVVLGAVIAAAVRGSTPPPPAPGLCWYWSDSYRENGYWDRCGAY